MERDIAEPADAVDRAGITIFRVGCQHSRPNN